MEIIFEKALERDMDLMLMRQFASNDKFLKDLFLKPLCKKYEDTQYEVISISHSVMTEAGESDVEVVLQIKDQRIALLIEDKIDAIAQDEQANRYSMRGDAAIQKNLYDTYYVYIVAPQKYLEHNMEARKYQHAISYETIKQYLVDPVDCGLMEKALDISKNGYIPVEDLQITAFWQKLYDFVDEHYPEEFSLHGKRGESRGAKASWITMTCGKDAGIQIKTDRGFVDLELSGRAAEMYSFAKANQQILDEKQVALRIAGKSLALRYYIEPIDFHKPFEEEVAKVKTAFDKALALQRMLKHLKL